MNASSLLLNLSDLGVQSDHVWVWWREDWEGLDLLGEGARWVTPPLCSLASAFLVTDTDGGHTDLLKCLPQVDCRWRAGKHRWPYDTSSLVTSSLVTSRLRSQGEGEEKSLDSLTVTRGPTRAGQYAPQSGLLSPPLIALSPASVGSQGCLPATFAASQKETLIQINLHEEGWRKERTQLSAVGKGMEWYKPGSRPERPPSSSVSHPGPLNQPMQAAASSQAVIYNLLVVVPFPFHELY